MTVIDISELFFYTTYKNAEGASFIKAQASQWKNYLINKGYKREEEDILSLSSYLTEQGERVITKQELLSFIKHNQLVLKETVLGGDEVDELRKKYLNPDLKNVKEIILSVPGIEPYLSEDKIHFGDIAENIGWARTGELYRNGERILVVDELQSLRHQAGDKFGYKSDIDDVKEPDILDLVNKYTPEEVSKILIDFSNAKADIMLRKQRAVPDTPFRRNWYQLLIKRMLRWATENDFDKIYFPTGQMQLKRYNLEESKRGMTIFYDKKVPQFLNQYVKKWSERLSQEGDYYVLDLSRDIKEAVLTAQPLMRECEGQTSRDSFDDIPILADVVYVKDEFPVRGWYDRLYDIVYVVPKNHRDIEDLQKTILHELVTHRGLRGVLGEYYLQYIDQIWIDIIPDSEKFHLIEHYQNKAKATEEWCSRLTLKDQGILEKITCAFKVYLMKKGFNITLSLSEIIYILNQSNKIYIKESKSMRTTIEIVNLNNKKEKVLLSVKNAPQLQEGIDQVISSILKDRGELMGLKVDIKVKSLKNKYSFVTGAKTMTDLKEYFLDNRILKSLGIVQQKTLKL